MMKRVIGGLFLTSIFLGLSTPAISAENDQRYISIRNTDSAWIQGVCSLVFRLDNGGDGEFKALAVSLQLTDKAGKALETGSLDVQPFGDSDATRSIDAATEFSCDAVENTANIVITKVDEIYPDGSVHALPTTVFDPQYYQPLKISVGQSR